MCLRKTANCAVVWNCWIDDFGKLQFISTCGVDWKWCWREIWINLHKFHKVLNKVYFITLSFNESCTILMKLSIIISHYNNFIATSVIDKSRSSSSRAEINQRFYFIDNLCIFNPESFQSIFAHPRRSTKLIAMNRKRKNAIKRWFSWQSS